MSRKVLVDDDAAQFANIEERLRRLEQGIPEDVHYVGDAGEPAFTNSWVNFDSVRPAGYYRDRGRVYLVGVIKTGASGSSAFTLPDGYRPPVGPLSRPAAAQGGIAIVDVASSGTVTPINQGATAVATAVYLDGISFRHA